MFEVLLSQMPPPPNLSLKGPAAHNAVYTMQETSEGVGVVVLG